MNSKQRLWRWLALIFVLSFGALGFIAHLREQYAMADGTLPVKADRQALTAFSFWTAWPMKATRKYFFAVDRYTLAELVPNAGELAAVLDIRRVAAPAAGSGACRALV